MERILYGMIFLFILTACSPMQDEEPTQSILDEDNEEIDFSKVKAFDIEKARESMDKELNKAYVPQLDKMYQASRDFTYHIQDETSRISSIYDLDQSVSDKHSTTVEASYYLAEKRSIKRKAEIYFSHLLKSIVGASNRIKYKGFSGYDTYYGAKLDQRSFRVEKDGYSYGFTPPRNSPDGYGEDFDFVTFSIDSLNKANEYEEWEEIEKDFISRLHFPDSLNYRPLKVEFTYNYDNDYTNEMLFSFDNDDTQFIFGAYEDGVSFDPESTVYLSNKDKISKESIKFNLTEELSVDRHLYSDRLEFKFVVYEWKWNDLYYYLSVRDGRVEDTDMFRQYEEDYIDVIRSLDESLRVKDEELANKDELERADESSPYYELVQTYKQAVEEKWDQDELGQALDYHMGPLSVRPRSLPDHYGYVLVDIHKNARPYLILGEVDHGSIYNIDEIFTLDKDDQVVKVFESSYLRQGEMSTDGLIRVTQKVSETSEEGLVNYYDLSELIGDGDGDYPINNIKSLRYFHEDDFTLYHIESTPAVHLKEK